MEIYIYSLKHPITNEVRYIGKTKNIKRRYYEHINTKGNSYKSNWIKSLLNEGIKPIIDIIEICNKDSVSKEPTNKIITNKNPTLQVIKLNNNSDINHSRKFIVVFD
jgi:hypothetical protein